MHPMRGGVAVLLAAACGRGFEVKPLEDGASCPSVYIYNESETRLIGSDATVERFRAMTEADAFGSICGDADSEE